MGMHPRWLKADTVFAQTQRTVDRQFLFRPDPVVTNIIGASAARAQEKHPVKIYWLDMNINHEQTGIGALSDSQEHLDNLIRFKQTFHRLLACELNSYLGREGAVFSSPSRNVECIDDQGVEQQFFYALTNPVKDGLVDRVAHWKGFSSYSALALGQPETYRYVDYTAWHRAGGKRSTKPLEQFVKTIQLKYTPLPGWENLTPEKRQAKIRRECRALETHFRQEREREGRRAMGPEKLAKVNHRDRPKTAPKRTPKPVCHSGSAEKAKAYKKALKTFLNAYAVASAYFRSGVLEMQFPPGSIRPPLIGVQV